MRKNIIWNSEINIDEWRDDVYEISESYPNIINEDGTLNADNFYDAIYDIKETYFEDEKANLDVPTEGDIIIIADLGLWDGRHTAYLDTHLNKANAILCAHMNGNMCFFSDGKDICATESHHDGINHYTYRVVKPNRDIDRLKAKIHNGEQITRQMISYYTRSLLPTVANVYGW